MKAVLEAALECSRQRALLSKYDGQEVSQFENFPISQDETILGQSVMCINIHQNVAKIIKL